MLSFRIKEELFRLAKTETVHQYYTDPKSYRNLWIRKTPMSARRRIVKAVGSTTWDSTKVTREPHGREPQIRNLNKQWRSSIKTAGKWAADGSKKSEVAQSWPTLCDPVDCSPPGFSIHGIFQAWVLEWVAISFSRGSSWPRDWTRVSCITGRCFTIWATR